VATVERKIHFFRILDNSSEPIELPWRQISEDIGKIPFVDDKRYLKDEWGRLRGVWPCTTTGRYPFLFQHARIRRNELPPVEDGGFFQSLNLAATAGLAEISHIVVFRDGFMAAEYNHYGPRANTLPSYIHAKLPEVDPFWVQHVLSRDASEKIRAMTELKVAKIKLTNSAASVLKESHTGLSETFSKAIEIANPASVELVLKAPRSGKLKDAFKQGMAELAANDSFVSSASGFWVKGGEPGDYNPLNVLKDSFVHTLRLELTGETSRAVKRSDAFSKMIALFEEQQPQLEDLAALSLERWKENAEK
jgi:hypothetical protein